MKTHRFFSVFLLLILAVSLLTGPASAAEVPDPAIQAKAALLVDANTGRMVYGKNEHEELYPASLTKIMTALLTLEAVDSGQLSMDQPITVTESALEGLAAFKEVNLFLRGIVPLVGYPSAAVEYERGERFAGESKYPLKKMLSFAMEGITSLSVKPIRYITALGFLIFFISILMLIYSIVRWAHGETVLGWASVICSVWAIGGLILLSLGVIGEYIGKIYLETKGRPRFLFREVLEDGHGQTD